MSAGINTETVARLADDCARKIVASPQSDLDQVLRNLIVEAMKIGSDDAFERMYRAFGVPRQEKA